MNEEDAKKNRTNFENIAKKRIKVGLILNEFGEQNKINVTEQEVQAEVQKQLRMMPGQEKMVMEFYQKNPSALASLRGTVYEEKIIDLIKTKAKSNKKEITKDQAEKIIKESQKNDQVGDHNHSHDHSDNHSKENKITANPKVKGTPVKTKAAKTKKKAKSEKKLTSKSKKVSKK